MIAVSNWDALFINVILTCRLKIFVVLWLQVAKVGASDFVFKAEKENLLGKFSIILYPGSVATEVSFELNFVT